MAITIDISELTRVLDKTPSKQNIMLVGRQLYRPIFLAVLIFLVHQGLIAIVAKIFHYAERLHTQVVTLRPNCAESLIDTYIRFHGMLIIS